MAGARPRADRAGRGVSAGTALPAGDRLAVELTELARLVRRLAPDRRDPERFHVEKDEAARKLAMLARRVEASRVTDGVQSWPQECR